MPKQKQYTVVAIYVDNNQRYAVDSFADSPTEAAIDAIEQARNDNGEPDMAISICAVFRGSHPSQDCRYVQADEGDIFQRPDPVRCRAKHNHRFTVVTDDAVHHVMDRNAVEAENGFFGAVAGVFRDHLNDLSHEIDWDRVNAETEVKKAA
ncbi:hypothetical protein AB4Y45_34775 [Paraburkholderia sp. EG287A]|uniref:hypothetical protein n=1 Tax=Paraburkholderia sp. EG287A TaxID=3237012 RepID=UPI0034D19F44